VLVVLEDRFSSQFFDWVVGFVVLGFPEEEEEEGHFVEVDVFPTINREEI